MLSVMLTEEPPHGFLNRWQGFALDKDDKPLEVPSLSPETEEEKRRYNEALKRREQRLSTRSLPGF